jgi:hypothetical protein
MQAPPARPIEPGNFEAQRHFYPRTLNAQLHPLVRYFLTLDNGRVAERYAHLHPEVDPDAIHAALAEAPRYFSWSGPLSCGDGPRVAANGGDRDEQLALRPEVHAPA